MTTAAAGTATAAAAATTDVPHPALLRARSGPGAAAGARRLAPSTAMTREQFVAGKRVGQECKARNSPCDTQGSP